MSNGQIVTPKAAEVFGYDDTDLAFVNHGHHALPIWSLKVCAGVPVIHKILKAPKAFFLSKLRQKCPLRRDLSRYVFVKKCAICVDKQQKERYNNAVIDNDIII